MMGADTGALIQERIQPALGGAIQIVIGMWGDQNADVPFELKRLNIGQGVAGEFRSAGALHLQDVAQSEVRPFAPGYTPDVGAAADILELPREAFDYPDLIDAILEPAVLPAFIPGRDRKLAFHCFVVRLGGVRAGFLRKAGGVLLARKGISAVFVQNRIERLDTEVLTFSPSVDILVEPNTLWISNVASHRSLFRNSQVLLNAISANVTAVAQVIPIANSQDFEEACRKDPRMMAKLAEVSAKGYLGNITPQAVRSVIEEYNLPPEVMNQAGRLVHDNTPKRRWLILKILDDSYLRSTMTNEHYEVNSKLGV